MLSVKSTLVSTVTWLEIVSKSVPVLATVGGLILGLFSLSISIHTRLDRLERQSSDNNNKLTKIESQVVDDHYNLRDHLNDENECRKTKGLGDK